MDKPIFFVYNDNRVFFKEDEKMKLKRVLCVALAALLIASSLLLGGCSTPKYALEADGVKFEMGDYLSYLYAVLTTDSNISMYCYYFGTEALGKNATYDKKEVTIEEYIKLSAQDSMIRQVALRNMMEEYGIEWDKDDLKDIEEQLKDLQNDAFIALGFNNDRYIKTCKWLDLNESSLFFGLYGKGGQKEVAKDDIKKYFDDNYLSYKMIEFSLVDSNSKELSDDKKAEIQKQLQKYLDAFNKGDKTGLGFDTNVYVPYLVDEEAKKEAEKESNKDSSSSTNSSTTTTTTTTAATTTTTTATSTDDKKDEADKEEEKDPTATRYDRFKEDITDEDLLKAIESIPEGTAEIKTYQKNGSTKTMALIFRMDPEAERNTVDKDGKEVVVDYVGDLNDTILQYMKFDEFNTDVEKEVDAIADTVVYHKRALNAADLETMVYLMYGAGA